jgi:hypothetical protein
MRAALGFILLQGILVAVGIGLLRALGLLAAGSRAAILGLGPAWLAGTASVVLLLLVLLVLGVPFTIGVAALVAAVVGGGAFAVARRRRAPVETRSETSASSSRRIGVSVAAAYFLAACVVLGAYALARAPTRGDDARIWSLKGLALTYYDHLRPEIFLNPSLGLSHPVYPPFQPVLEALLGRAMGRPELALFHTELWLILIAAVWTGAYLLWWRRSRPLKQQVGLALLALLVTNAAVIVNIWSGYADVTGSILLALGALAVALWIEGENTGHLWLAALLLAAAANTKDEDFVGVVLVLVISGVMLAARKDRTRLRLWIGGAAASAVLIAPWRIWTAAHHLSDNVVPPLPRALSPVYVLDRLPQLRQTAAAMLTQSLNEYGWLAAIFVAVCILCIATRTTRRVAAFYLASFAAAVVALLWLYTTTRVSLGFLIPTSMARTVDVFMVFTPFASAHLLTRLLAPVDARES